MDRYEISEVNLGKSEYICFEIFEVWVLNLPLNVKKIHNQSVAELVHCITVLYAQGLGACFGETWILLSSIYFFRTSEAITSPLNLESSWQSRYSTVSCCLMEWPANDILIPLKPRVFEKRLDLFLSSRKWIDSMLSINHWHNEEKSLFKTFSFFLTSSCW